MRLTDKQALARALVHADIERLQAIRVAASYAVDRAPHGTRRSRNQSVDAIMDAYDAEIERQNAHRERVRRLANV